MSQVAPTPAEAKPTNRWNNISSDEDDSQSEHSDHEQKTQQPIQQKAQEVALPSEPKEEPKKKEAHIVPFDAKKKFRGGDFAHLKTVKGGFKAEKLEKKKFHLDTVRNPFSFGNQDDSDSEEEPQETKQEQAVKEPESVVEKPAEEDKKPKKSKKQQEKEQLEALLKELKGNEEPKEEGEKKKKKKKPKKAEGEAKQEQKEAVQEPMTEEVKPAEDFSVSKQALEEVMRKKAQAGKTANKKPTGKANIANAAKRAIEEREAKNKAKKVYIDL